MRITVDSETWKHGFRVIYGVVPFLRGFGVRGQQYSNFLASTEGAHTKGPQDLLWIAMLGLLGQ